MGYNIFNIMNITKEINLYLEPGKKQAQIFKVLAHPARLSILEILREGEHCVCHIEACLGYRQAYISQQLMVLRDAGLIQDRRDGLNVFYQVINPDIYPIIDAARSMLNIPDFTLPQKGGMICSCPKCSGDA